MAEADELGDIGELNKKDVERYYARGPRFSTAACTANELSRFCDDIGLIMDSLHPEILARSVNCFVYHNVGKLFIIPILS